MTKAIKAAVLILALAVLAAPFMMAHAAGQAKHAGGRFPNLQAAKRLLNNARSRLQDAPDEFGGHRAAALKLVDQAIVEVNQAIDYGNANPGAKTPAIQGAAH